MKFTKLLFIVAALSMTKPLFASTAGLFGVVNMQQVILTVAEGKAARNSLEKEIKAKEKELLGQKKELDKLNQEWKKQSALLSESARMEKQKSFQQKFMTLRQAEMEFQAAIKRKEQLATQKIAVKVAKVVEELARKKKLTAVFELNSAGLLYLEKPIDLTKEVVELYEKKSK
jgi:outer membrane protein